MAALQRFALISLLAWSVAAALPQVPEETDTIIIKLAEGGDQPGAGGFAVASAADEDSAATLGKHIGHRLHRLRAQPGESVQQALTRVRAMKGERLRRQERVGRCAARRAFRFAAHLLI